MKKVTDPALLSQLGGGTATGGASTAPTGLTRVTDPALFAQLNAAPDQMSAGLAPRQLRPAQPAPPQGSPTAFGAPVRTRAAVGAAGSPEDKLNTLRAFYPNARPYGDDNYIYTDESGQTRLFNEEGWIPDFGDIAQAGPTIAEIIGGTGGAIAGGLAAGAPTGGIGALPGAAAGAAAGGLLGKRGYEAVAQWLSPARSTQSLAERGLEDVETALVGATGEAGGRALGALASAVGRKLLTKPGAATRAAQFEQAGVSTAGAPGEIAGGRFAPFLAKNVERLPGGQRLAAAQEASVESMEQAVRRAGEGITGGRALPERGTLGATLREGAEMAGTQWGEQHGQLYKNMLAQTEGIEVGVDQLQGLRTLRNQFDQQITDAPGTSGHLTAARNELDQVLGDVAEGNTVSYQQLREYQTDLQQRLRDPTLATGYTGKTGQGLERVLRTLKQDLGTTVQYQRPGAMDAVRGHDAFVVDFHEAQRTGKSTAQVLETMLSRETDQLVNYVKQGSKGGVERLRQLEGVIPEAQWDQFRAGYLLDMGRNPKTGDFSPTRFRGAYNELPAESRGVLFKGQENRIKALSEVGDMMAEAETAVNRSNTGIANTVATTLGAGGMLVDPGMVLQAAALPAANYAMSRALTNPKFAQWAAGTLPPAMMTEALKGGVGRLGAMQFGPQAEAAALAELERGR